jgi:hypothetical protein
MPDVTISASSYDSRSEVRADVIISITEGPAMQTHAGHAGHAGHVVNVANVAISPEIRHSSSPDYEHWPTARAVRLWMLCAVRKCCA